MAQLKPNCLLTKRPLKLVSGPRSIFYYQKPWADLPSMLYEHGYKVDIFHLPFNNPELRKKAFSNRFSELNGSHIIVDPQTALEFKDQLAQVQGSTLTVIGKDFVPNYHPTSLAYILHKKWLALQGWKTVTAPENLFIKAPLSVHYAFIDHCVKLAELDFLS